MAFKTRGFLVGQVTRRQFSVFRQVNAEKAARDGVALLLAQAQRALQCTEFVGDGTERVVVGQAVLKIGLQVSASRFTPGREGGAGW